MLSIVMTKDVDGTVDTGLGVTKGGIALTATIGAITGAVLATAIQFICVKDANHQIKSFDGGNILTDMFGQENK